MIYDVSPVDVLTVLVLDPGHAQSRSMNDIADTPSTDQVTQSSAHFFHICKH